MGSCCIAAVARRKSQSMETHIPEECCNYPKRSTPFPSEDFQVVMLTGTRKGKDIHQHFTLPDSERASKLSISFATTRIVSF